MNEGDEEEAVLGQDVVLREKEVLLNLLQLLPQKAQLGFTGLKDKWSADKSFKKIISVARTNEPVRVEYTCIDASEKSIVLGSNIGIVFLYLRDVARLSRFICNNKQSAVVCVKLLEEKNFIATGQFCGSVTIFKFEEDKNGQMKASLKCTVESHHTTPVTCIQWTPDGMKLFTADSEGNVAITVINMDEGKTHTVFICKEDSPVTQLSFCHTALLISTLKRSLVWPFTTKKIVQVGRQERKSIGNFGACFFPPHGPVPTNQEVKIYAARPGFRLWNATMEGKVCSTMIFRESISKGEPPIETIDLPSDAAGSEAKQFGTLKAFNDRFLVSWQGSCLWVIDPSTGYLIGCHNNLGCVVGVVAISNELFVLTKNEEQVIRHVTYETCTTLPCIVVEDLDLNNPQEIEKAQRASSVNSFQDQDANLTDKIVDNVGSKVKYVISDLRCRVKEIKSQIKSREGSEEDTDRYLSSPSNTQTTIASPNGSFSTSEDTKSSTDKTDDSDTSSTEIEKCTAEPFGSSFDDDKSVPLPSLNPAEGQTPVLFDHLSKQDFPSDIVFEGTSKGGRKKRRKKKKNEETSPSRTENGHSVESTPEKTIEDKLYYNNCILPNKNESIDEFKIENKPADTASSPEFYFSMDQCTNRDDVTPTLDLTDENLSTLGVKTENSFKFEGVKTVDNHKLDGVKTVDNDEKLAGESIGEQKPANCDTLDKKVCQTDENQTIAGQCDAYLNSCEEDGVKKDSSLTSLNTLTNSVENCESQLILSCHNRVNSRSDSQFHTDLKIHGKTDNHFDLVNNDNFNVNNSDLIGDICKEEKSIPRIKSAEEIVDKKVSVPETEISKEIPCRKDSAPETKIPEEIPDLNSCDKPTSENLPNGNVCSKENLAKENISSLPTIEGSAVKDINALNPELESKLPELSNTLFDEILSKLEREKTQANKTEVDKSQSPVIENNLKNKENEVNDKEKDVQNDEGRTKVKIDDMSVINVKISHQRQGSNASVRSLGLSEPCRAVKGEAWEMKKSSENLLISENDIVLRDDDDEFPAEPKTLPLSPFPAPQMQSIYQTRSISLSEFSFSNASFDKTEEERLFAEISEYDRIDVQNDLIESMESITDAEDNSSPVENITITEARNCGIPIRKKRRSKNRPGSFPSSPCSSDMEGRPLHSPRAEAEVLRERLRYLADSWADVELPACGQLQHICCSATLLWAVDTHDHLFCAPAHKSNAYTWKKINGSAVQVACNEEGTVVWSVDRQRVAYFRMQIKDSTPQGNSWERFEENIHYVAVDNDCVWVIKTNGDVCARTHVSQHNPAGTAWRNVKTGSDLVQISALNGLVWALDIYNHVQIYQGESVAEEDRWCELPAMNAIHVLMGASNVCWVIDKDHGIWFNEDICKECPLGGTWYQLSLGEHQTTEASWFSSVLSYFRKGNEPKMIVSNQRAGVLILGKQGTLHVAHGHLLGTRWEPIGPPQLSKSSCFTCVAAGGADMNKGYIWALQPNGQLFCFKPHGQSYNVHPPQQVVLKYCSTGPRSLWALTAGSEVYIRIGISETCPQGLKWLRVNMIAQDNKRLVNICCGNLIVWAVDFEGNAWFQMSRTEDRHNKGFAPAWVAVEGCPLDGSKFTKVVVGPEDRVVWACDDMNNVYCRRDVSENFWIGTSWEVVAGTSCKDLAVSRNHVWGLCPNGDVICRFGVSRANVMGNYWKKVPGNFERISVGVNDELWGVDRQGHLYHRQTMLFYGSTLSARAPSYNDLFSDHNDWELI